MTGPDDVVFLLDVDHTLLDNGRGQDDFRIHLGQALGTVSDVKRVRAHAGRERAVDPPL